MATFARPGVEITQVVSAISPAVTTPTLVPCIVGPCYQIVTPLDSTGQLDSTTKITLPAELKSSADLADPLAISGHTMKLQVNGTEFTINFPVTIGGASISYDIVKSTINTALTGASATFLSNRLLIRTDSKGASASLKITQKLQTAAGADSDILLLNGDYDISKTGLDEYNNQSYVIPYSHFPSPKAPAAEILITGEDTKAYGFINSTLTEFSKTSAINVNSYSFGDTKYANTNASPTGAAITYDVQPAHTVGRATLAGKKVSGSTTNTLYHMGTEASVTIPLAYDTNQGVATAQEPHWPDPAGSAYLKVTATGMQNYLTGGTVGDYVGVAGNAVTVVFAFGATTNFVDASWGASALTITRSDTLRANTCQAGSAATTAVLDAGSSAVNDFYNGWLFTITAGTGIGQTRRVTDYVGATKTATVATWDVVPDNTSIFRVSEGEGATFAQLATALTEANITNLDTGAHVTVTLTSPTAWAAKTCLGYMTPAGAWGANTKTYYLGGGTDPVDFSNVPAGNEQVAYITGCTASGAKNPEAFQPSLVGEKFYVSADGGAWEELTLASGSTAVSQINGMTGVTAAAITLTNSLAETSSVIQLKSAGTEVDHDSTLEIKADNAQVIADLFGGYKTRTVTLANFDAAPALNARKASLAQSTDYNKEASAQGEKGLVPGSLVFELTDAILHGAFVSYCPAAKITTAKATWGVDDDLYISHTGVGGGTPVQLVVVKPVATTAAEVATRIDTQIEAGTLDTFVSCRSVGDWVIISNARSTGTIYLDTAGPTDAAILALLGADLFSAGTITQTSTTGTITLKDSGTDNAMQVTAVSPTTQITLSSDVLLDVTSATDLTSAFLDTTSLAGSKTEIDYTTGAVDLVFNGDLEAVAANQFPFLASFAATTDVDFTYSRAWGCATAAAAPLYTARVFSGMSDATLAGDKLYNGTTLLGKVVSVENFAPAATTYTGAQIVLSEYAATANTAITDWYIRAENLTSTDTRAIDAEASYNTAAATFTIKHALLADSAGVPATGAAAVYIDYKALRTDVTGAAADPDMLVFNNTTEVESSIGPIATTNPLAWGIYSAFLNAPTISIAALGVDEISADAPNGTLDGYERALDYLELKKIWSLVPLTQDREVHKLCSTHVTAMSLPANKKPRVAWVNQALPTETESTLVASGSCILANIGGGKYELTFPVGTNLATSLTGLKDAAGNTLATGAGQTYDPADGLYMDLGSDGYKYHVSQTTSARVVEINTNDIYQPGSGPATSGNGDSYYVTGTDATAALGLFTVTGETCVLYVRQAAISKATTAGKLSIAETLAEISGGTSGYVNKRIRFVQPEKVGMTENGTEVLVDGFYACCMLAGMRGQLSPSQPLTNLPLTGLTRPVGSSDLFSETHMATAAAGGAWWLIQDTDGGSVITRHQLTTDMTSLNTREDSVVAAIDYIEYSIRDQISRFIGRYNINKQLLEAVSLGLNGVLASLEGSIVAEASLDKIIQDTANPDTILVDVSLTPFYAANKISVTIVV